MPYSLLDYINPVTIHIFYVRLLQWTTILMIIVLVILTIWRLKKSNIKSTVLDKPVALYPRGYSVLWWGIGILWVIDGLLQAQPPMATSMFVDMDVATNVAGQPHWLLTILGAGIQAWTDHQITSAVIAVLIQVFIGVGILLGYRRRLGRIALYTSLVWSIPVWIYGEGVGDLFASGASWLTGSPGAVVFYITGAVWLLLPVRYWNTGKIAQWTRYGIGVVWLILAVYQALPSAGYWSSQGLYNVFRFNTLMPQPAVMLIPILWAMHQSALHPLIWNGTMVAVMTAIGIMMLTGRTGKAFWILTFLWLSITWWLGQDFGIVGGVGTDPQAAPLIFLLMIGGWWYARDGATIQQNPHSVRKPALWLKQLAWILSVTATAVLALFGFAIPQTVEAQGDAPSPVIHYHATHTPKTFDPQHWLRYDKQTHTVHLLIVASVNQFGSLSFDGYSNGFMTITIPTGWTVYATFVNKQVLLKNSAMIVTHSQLLRGGPFTPAFTGSTSPQPDAGVDHGIFQHFHFVAGTPGRYAIVSAVPDGQTDSGMWANFLVNTGSHPSITVK